MKTSIEQITQIANEDISRDQPERFKRFTTEDVNYILKAFLKYKDIQRELDYVLGEHRVQTFMSKAPRSPAKVL